MQRFMVRTIAVRTIAPVSYTHLDVYKRQEKGLEPWYKQRAMGQLVSSY